MKQNCVYCLIGLSTVHSSVHVFTLTLVYPFFAHNSVVLNKPLLLSSGFIVHTQQRSKLRITSLADLTIGQLYTTEKGTTLFRRSDTELLLGGECVKRVASGRAVRFARRVQNQRATVTNARGARGALPSAHARCAQIKSKFPCKVLRMNTWNRGKCTS